jgi:Sulfatase
MHAVKWNSPKTSCWLSIMPSMLGVPLAAGRAAAQRVTGVAGSPRATTTIDGKQLPPPPLKFGGVENHNANNSIPWWAPHVVPPKDAPNVLLIMTDDQGSGVAGTFGGVIPTPSLDRIASDGLR